MTFHEMLLLSPELALVALALGLILLDLLVERKTILGDIAMVGLVIPVVLSIGLWMNIVGGSTVPASGLSGVFLVDSFSQFFKVLILGTTGLVILASRDYVVRLPGFHGEYYGLLLISASGMMLLVSSMEMISIYVALELATLPLVILSTFLRQEKSIEAGVKFLILAALSSAILLYGIALMYGLTGTTHLLGIGAAVRFMVDGTLPGSGTALLVITGFLVAGFGFKIASVPFHMWVPDVYEGAPTPITAYLSIASKAAGFAILLRILYTALGALASDWAMLFAMLAALSMTVGNLAAIVQGNIKRLLGYSTIANAGYIMVGVAAVAQSDLSLLGDYVGPSAIVFYLLTYAVSNMAVFFSVIVISDSVGSDQIEDYKGQAFRTPWLAVALALGLISLIGLPPTAGFIGKLYIFKAAISSQLVWLAVVGVINSVVSAYYYLRIVRLLYSTSPAVANVQSSYSLTSRVAIAIVAASVLILGIVPSSALNFAESAGRALNP